MFRSFSARISTSCFLQSESWICWTVSCDMKTGTWSFDSCAVEKNKSSVTFAGSANVKPDNLAQSEIFDKLSKLSGAPFLCLTTLRPTRTARWLSLSMYLNIFASYTAWHLFFWPQSQCMPRFCHRVYVCEKFGVDSSSRFPFRARTRTHTKSQNPLNVLPMSTAGVGSYYRDKTTSTNAKCII